MLRVSNTYPTTITIDGEPVRLRIKRFTKDESIEFVSLFSFYGKEGIRAARANAPSEEEKKLSALEIEARREAGLTEEERESRRQEAIERQRRGDEFALDAITRYVEVEADQIAEEETGTQVRTGAELVRYYQARPDVLSDLMQEIFLQNRLSADQKKALSLLRASRPTSLAPAMVDGPRPDATASAVSAPDTAIPAGATDADARTRSGSTAISSSTPVPSSSSRRTSKRGSPGSGRSMRRSSSTDASGGDVSASPAEEASASRMPS